MSTILIIGASRGIGLCLARNYASSGHHVIGTVRTGELPGLETINGVDLASPEAPARVASALGARRIDVLIHNAGIFAREALPELDFFEIQRQFDINTMAPLRMVAGLLGHLAAGAKIGLVSSRMGSLGDNTSGAYYGYRMSKAALNMAGVSLARDLAPQGIAVALLHPGFVRTELTGGRGDVEPEVAAAGIVARMDALTVASSGRFWHANGQELPF